MWRYEEKDLRDDVKLNLPDGFKCRVFKVTSGDSGEKYWVQLVYQKRDPLATLIAVCQCPEGYFKFPLTVLCLRDFCCKHVQNLLQFLKEKGDLK